MFNCLLIVFSITLFPILSLACASCGCTLSSDWADGSQKGLKLDFRWDYLNQNQLRSGTKAISASEASQVSYNGNAQEVEVYTKNNYLTASAEYSINPDWKVAIQIPYLIRDHSTLGTASDGTTAGPGGGQYTSGTSSLGDLKILGRFQGFSEQHNFGVLAGLKLPTGSYTLKGVSSDSSAPGTVPIDRGLQPGTGTTDLIFGLYYTEAMNKDWDYFGEGLYQAALNSKDDFKPGDGFNLNVGFRYVGLESLTPQIQLNSRYVLHDSGANSDPISTGGTLVYLSPGLIVPTRLGLDVYTFAQVPIYQYVQGVQLTPTYSVSFGVRYLL